MLRELKFPKISENTTNKFPVQPNNSEFSGSNISELVNRPKENVKHRDQVTTVILSLVPWRISSC